MDITQVAAAAPATNTTTNAASGANSVLTSDFEVFLTMLTAQAEYQDPLEPIDSSEYAAQLAQFSMVEQQVSTNALLEQMLSAFGANDMSGAANWIGLEALTSGPVRFDGSPVTISPNPPVTADTVELVVYNSQGVEVDRRNLPLGQEAYVWDGRRNSGGALAYGEYALKIESRSNGQVIQEDPALSYARVTEARIEDGATFLVLDGGYKTSAANVLGLREPI